MFFQAPHEHFFRPLNGKYRESLVESLHALYERLYSINADYGESLRREQLIDIIEEALARAPLLDDEDESDIRFRSPREQAVWIFNQLLECGWLQHQVDDITLVATYPFTRVGRLFTQTFVEHKVRRVHTRHRNTRNTLNALAAFQSRGEPHDLIDAWTYSEHIITDFTDIISELEERKRELVKEVDAAGLTEQASDQFFDFMENRFKPDLAIRLSADSVEKHRNAIEKAITAIRRKDKTFKANAERALRGLLPELIEEKQSVLLQLLGTIEWRLRNACDIMLPALRRALHGFTKRADLIIRQISYLHNQSDNQLLTLCQHLSDQNPQDRDALLARLADELAPAQLGYIDPEQVRLHARRKKPEVQTRLPNTPEADQREALGQFLERRLEQAFQVNDGRLRQYVSQQLSQQKAVCNSELDIDSAEALLSAANLTTLAGARSDEFQIHIEPTGKQFSSEYFDAADEFRIELKKL